MASVLCVRLKKLRQSRSASPSDVTAAYQFHRPQPDDGTEGAAGANTSDRSSSSAFTTKRSYSDSHRFPNRLCRHFSKGRRIRSIHLPLKASGRHNGVSAFSLSSRLSRSMPVPTPVLTVLNSWEGSLTCERGYDSDAQYISSPKNVALSPSPVTKRNLPSLGCGYPRAKLGDLNERSQEQLGNSLGISIGCPEKCRGTSPATGDLEYPNAAAMISMMPVELREGPQIEGSDIEIRSPVSHGNVSASCSHDLTILPAMDNSCTGRINDSSGGSDRKPFEPTADYCSEIFVAKKHQQSILRSSLSEPRSVHLGDMNISQALASPSLLSPLTTPLLSQSELADGDPRGLRNTCSMSEGLGTATIQSSQNFEAIASPHSLNSRILLAQSAHRQRSKTWNFTAMDRYLTKVDRQAISSRSLNLCRSHAAGRSTYPERLNGSDEAACLPTPAAQVLKSKFIEKIERDPLSIDQCTWEVPDGREGAPRKISAGWISGGRRIGYGYSMVDPNKAKSEGQARPGVWTDEGRSSSGTVYGSIASIPSMISCLAAPSSSNNATPLEESAVREATNGNLNTVRTWTKVASRVKSRSSSIFSTLGTVPGHWPVFGSEGFSERPPRRTSISEKDINSFRRTSAIDKPGNSRRTHYNAAESTHNIKECLSVKVPRIRYPLFQKTASQDSRLLALKSTYGSERKGAIDAGANNDRASLKSCGWTREARFMPATLLASNLTGSAAPEASRHNSDSSRPLRQSESDDTTEGLIYQDCMEIIPEIAKN